MTQSQAAPEPLYEGLTFAEVEHRYPKALVWELQPGKPLSDARYLTALKRVRVVDLQRLRILMGEDKPEGRADRG
jgi:hypothetical protein